MKSSGLVRLALGVAFSALTSVNAFAQAEKVVQIKPAGAVEAARTRFIDAANKMVGTASVSSSGLATAIALLNNATAVDQMTAILNNGTLQAFLAKQKSADPAVYENLAVSMTQYARVVSIGALAGPFDFVGRFIEYAPGSALTNLNKVFSGTYSSYNRLKVSHPLINPAQILEAEFRGFFKVQGKAKGLTGPDLDKFVREQLTAVKQGACGGLPVAA